MLARRGRRRSQAAVAISEVRSSYGGWRTFHRHVATTLASAARVAGFLPRNPPANRDSLIVADAVNSSARLQITNRTCGPMPFGFRSRRVCCARREWSAFSS